MKKKNIEAFALEAAKGIKTAKDLEEFQRLMTKATVEAALNAELDAHLGYEKHERSPSGKVAMVTAASKSRRSMVSLNSTHRVTVRVVLNPSW